MKKLLFLMLLLDCIYAHSQVTIDDLKVDKNGKYHYKKNVTVSGMKASSISENARVFLTDYSGFKEGVTWNQVRGTNNFVAALSIEDPRSVIVDLKIIISDGKYTYDLTILEFDYNGDYPAEIALASTKEIFAEIREEILQGIDKLSKTIDKSLAAKD